MALSAMLVGDPEALPLTAMLPELLPADAGANCTANAMFAPPLIVWGKPSPPILNP